MVRFCIVLGILIFIMALVYTFRDHGDWDFLNYL